MIHQFSNAVWDWFVDKVRYKSKFSVNGLRIDLKFSALIENNSRTAIGFYLNWICGSRTCILVVEAGRSTDFNHRFQDMSDSARVVIYQEWLQYSNDSCNIVGIIWAQPHWTSSWLGGNSKTDNKDVVLLWFLPTHTSFRRKAYGAGLVHMASIPHTSDVVGSGDGLPAIDNAIKNQFVSPMYWVGLW